MLNHTLILIQIFNFFIVQVVEHKFILMMEIHEISIILTEKLKMQKLKKFIPMNVSRKWR